MKAIVFTLGCKVNEVESASIIAALEGMGFETCDRLGYADIYVLNTCAVTREAERKSRQLIARALKYNPNAKVFVCGCASQKDEAAFKGRGVYFVTGARKKEEIITAVADLYGLIGCPLPYPKQTKTRAFVKIQDGCNNFCSYCIIPYLRGRERSRPVQDIVNEISLLTNPEIVLTGINVSSYHGGLESLVTALYGVDKRIRFGSLECSVITDSFLTALKGLKDFAPQFHLSLQSGSNPVLKAMNRHYTREEYLQKCASIYKYFPDAAITTDIIVGFPTESEEDFNESLSIIDEAGFARVHAFAFSPREGTVAYRLKDVPPEIKSARLHKLLEKAEESQSRYISRFLNTVAEVITEEYDGEYVTGYTQNYIKVYLKNLPTGKKYKVKLLRPFKDGVIAESDE